MSVAILKHTAGTVEYRNLATLDNIQIRVMVDLNRSPRTRTAELADQRMQQAMTDLANRLAMTTTGWLRECVPDDVVVCVLLD